MSFITQGRTNLKYILIVVILAAIVGGGILTYQYWWIPKEEGPPASPVDETSNWKTYRNEEFGFEIKYPSYFFFEQSEGATVIFASKEWENKMVHNPAVYISVIGETDFSLQEWLDENGTPTPILQEPEDYRYYGVTDVKTDVINDIQVLQFNHWAVSGGGDSVLAKNKSNILYEIHRHSSGVGTFPKDVFDQMLSTFKFIKEKATWKTLKSTYLGFEINYPYNWSYGEKGGTPHFYSPVQSQKEFPPINWGAVIWFDRTGVQSFDEFIADRFGPTTNNKIISDSNISLNNLSGREIVYTCKDCEVKYIPETEIYIPGDEGRVILILKNSDTFIIWFYYYKDDPRAADYLEIFNQMLFTFRFLEWKYGCEFI